MRRAGITGKEEVEVVKGGVGMTEGERSTCFILLLSFCGISTGCGSKY